MHNYYCIEVVIYVYMIVYILHILTNYVQLERFNDGGVQIFKGSTKRWTALELDEHQESFN
jgi:hypothetical protein